MIDALGTLFDGSFMPHGHCFLWREDLLLMHVGGDSMTTAAYFAIPAALVYLVRRRDDLSFNWIFVMFAAFIFACGTTHLMGIINVWNGFYHIEGAVKVATGVVSVATAVAIWRLMPTILSQPSRAQLVAANAELEQAQRALEESNRFLEGEVFTYTQALEEQARELQEANERLSRQARTDELTGLANRRKLMELLEHEVARSLRYGEPLALMLLDLDDFKAINDGLGHDAGDAALKGVAEVLRRTAREADIVGRHGGEEFLVVTPSTRAEDAGILAERLRAALASEKLETGRGTVRVTCSIGVAGLAGPEDDLDGLLRRADEALYRAKARGKDRVADTNGSGKDPTAQ